MYTDFPRSLLLVFLGIKGGFGFLEELQQISMTDWLRQIAEASKEGVQAAA